ncbi:unnamed protein product [Linum tenue]|uniref:Uncharacterized protein n=1 Tax=Linum tenue TaxID=586396 RepID=A0AAV0N1U5_9ROSI|nr:unnamed protein product [Linum tenue]
MTLNYPKILKSFRHLLQKTGKIMMMCMFLPKLILLHHFQLAVLLKISPHGNE